MEVVLDACTIINLINGGILHKILKVPSFNTFIGDVLMDNEILEVGQKMIIQAFVNNSEIQLLESTITLSEFTAVKSLYGLGDGETECISISKKFCYHIATDDGKARKAAIKELGANKVVGSLYLIREAVRQGKLSCEEAKQAFFFDGNQGRISTKNQRELFMSIAL